MNALTDEKAAVTAYIGIAHAYVLQENFAVANYYLNLYKGPVTRQFLQIKLITLNGLINTNTELSDKTLVKQNINEIKQQLGITAPLKVNAAPLNNSQASILEPAQTSVTKQNLTIPAGQKLGSRIRTAANGHDYIIIEQGDTLYRIAIDSNINMDKLREINHLKGNEVVNGNKLFLN